VQGDPSPYHCLAPLYTVNPKVRLVLNEALFGVLLIVISLFLCIQSALCVFNFNIGPFTFVSGESIKVVDIYSV
jgi:hypothetical protein